MDLIPAKIEAIFSSLMDKEGFLPARFDLALDALAKDLVGITDQASCSSETALSIRKGLQSIHEIAHEAGSLGAQGDAGSWSFQIFGSPQLSTSLVLNCNRSGGAEFFFQVDSNGQICGAFTLALKNEPEERLYTFEPRPDGWVVRQPGEANTTRPFELPEGYELPWIPAHEHGFLDILLPAEGHGIMEWIKSLPPSDSNPGQPVQPSLPAPKVCRKCGAPLEPNVRFCGQCAAPVQAEQAPAAPAPMPEPALLSPDMATTIATWHVVVQPGGRTMALAGRLSIGREQDNDLYLQDNKLSRHHAVIEAGAKGWQVRDLGSTNGTAVNGARISAPLLLKAGDVIELGNTRLTLELR